MRPTSGFSLVELAMVLVILGLLVGGILAGRSLIHAGELRRVSTDIGKYRTAIYAFRDRYLGFPGDITNATQFWGTDSGGCHGGNAGTCNGNGDGMVDAYEGAVAWEQLSLTGLVEGNYNAVRSLPVVLGTELPLSPFPQAGYQIWYIDRAGVFLYNSGNGIRLAKPKTNEAGNLGARFLLPEDAWNIDTKSDDGLPDTGRVTASNDTGCIGSSAPYAYQLDRTTSFSCALMFRF